MEHRARSPALWRTWANAGINAPLPLKGLLSSHSTVSPGRDPPTLTIHQVDANRGPDKTRQTAPRSGIMASVGEGPLPTMFAVYTAH